MIGPMALMVAVVGGGEATPEESAAAEIVGRELARRGCVVVCGGRTGVMEAACRGARSEGGHTIGILPGRDRSEANPGVEFAVVTGIGEARNLAVVLTADVVIAIGGGYGTLSEIALASKAGKPVVGLRTWSVALRGEEDQSVLRVADPTDAVEAALAAARTRAG